MKYKNQSIYVRRISTNYPHLNKFAYEFFYVLNGRIYYSYFGNRAEKFQYLTESINLNKDVMIELNLIAKNIKTIEKADEALKQYVANLIFS